MEQKIIEGNKLIAEFMKLPKCKRCTNCGGYDFGSGIIFTPDEMNYYSSWDWIIPVTEKIMHLHNIPDLYKQTCKVMEGLSMLDIKWLYNAVVVFIKWYNQKNIL